MAKIKFDSQSSEGRKAIIVSFDMEGFSSFCNHADAHIEIPRFVSQLFEQLNTFFLHPIDELLVPGRSGDGQLEEPCFIKYTGDGAIMVWLSNNRGEFTEQFCTDIVIAMRALQVRFATLVPEWERKWRTRGLPKRARFGISMGLIYGLLNSYTIIKGDPVDYVGYCINLAVRLQDHCRELGFLIHETLHPKMPGLVRLCTKDMKGAQAENVLAFEIDVKHVPDSVLKRKFIVPEPTR